MCAQVEPNILLPGDVRGQRLEILFSEMSCLCMYSKTIISIYIVNKCVHNCSLRGLYCQPDGAHSHECQLALCERWMLHVITAYSHINHLLLGNMRHLYLALCIPHGIIVQLCWMLHAKNTSNTFCTHTLFPVSCLWRSNL